MVNKTVQGSNLRGYREIGQNIKINILILAYGEPFSMSVSVNGIGNST